MTIKAMDNLHVLTIKETANIHVLTINISKALNAAIKG